MLAPPVAIAVSKALIHHTAMHNAKYPWLTKARAALAPSSSPLRGNDSCRSHSRSRSRAGGGLHRVAVWVVVNERNSPGGGNWISLNGMSSYLDHFSRLAAARDCRARAPDYQKNVDMGGAILTCAVPGLFGRRRPEWLIGQVLRGPDS